MNLADCLSDLGKSGPGEALEQWTSALLGPDHPATQACSANLAITLRTGDRSEEPGRLRSRVVDDMRQTLGDEHPNVVAVSRRRVDQDLGPPFM
ncbi:tetratricopeptide repeat protein [Streptosporangium minutum]|uniref:Tetratricopeptide repeat protein n=1 Tax=Streptosporangium minutum TaxID=569862 RepID=A0A243RCC2_9ACTN|nr:tetratricopeptide repeat protein [Streptosporangium minutum]OUC92304.1 hypothetical protein CA984_30510 [Streptosporangium minutum]